ncbi:substrate-binding domain-containing protein [Thioflexithrix psekupsensis]|uniref:Sugar ABC transporter substrate-binding protein n=1 Tax=Thioflexithrix psekupsensis TaxID=1570016 RepID=A0A251X4D1_9GAMM|nr:substrate-binding domain-containing protein [Thioflexithrix psekupsensis]OUD12039.1 sugar ABC transporter substrate-binding protein [Thioflexithrix psekupsensis]
MQKWLCFSLLIGCGFVVNVSAQNAPYRIGFSQATTTEPWRLLFNQQLRDEAAKYPEIHLLVTDGLDRAEKQISDVENLLQNKIDALLISPKVADALTPIVNQVYQQGIPVFVLDRNISNDDYTQFIGGDNLLIGRTAGEYVVQLLGGKGQAKGRIVEIWGIPESTPAQERHRGFQEVIAQETGIVNLTHAENANGQYKQDMAYELMAHFLDQYSDIDLVYAHNDPMAYGAYLAAKDLGREKNIYFLGIDGIPSEGMRWVNEGILTATFVYQTPGAVAIQQALKVLQGESVEKRIILPTQVVDKNNVAEMLTQPQ